MWIKIVVEFFFDGKTMNEKKILLIERDPNVYKNADGNIRKNVRMFYVNFKNVIFKNKFKCLILKRNQTMLFHCESSCKTWLIFSEKDCEILR